ncbi:TPA: hypothetical protein EYP13_02950, partial [Candidatus Micrarchaeota archaeon]|nr:hypothetical protein [Candidatus Micrarchaeota archaeon]
SSDILKEILKIEKIIIEKNEKIEKIFEKLAIPSYINKNIELFYPKTFFSVFFDLENLFNLIEEFPSEINQDKTVELLNKISFVKFEEKSGTFIGARMGRPEKAKMREMKGAPEMLFVVGKEGGRMRNFIEAHLKYGYVKEEVSLFKCKKCGELSLYKKCVFCNNEGERVAFCKDCGEFIKVKEENNNYFCEKCGKEVKISTNYKLETEIYLKTALRILNLKDYPQLLKGVRKMSSKEKIVERLEKGLACNFFQLKKNKDGTIRYDATQAGVTHFRPKDLLYTTIEDLKKLGYTKDIFGNDLKDENQILELKVQDVILPACEESGYEGSDKVLFRVTKYLDYLLEKLYGL